MICFRFRLFQWFSLAFGCFRSEREIFIAQNFIEIHINAHSGWTAQMAEPIENRYSLIVSQFSMEKCHLYSKKTPFFIRCCRNMIDFRNNWVFSFLFFVIYFFLLYQTNSLSCSTLWIGSIVEMVASQNQTNRKIHAQHDTHWFIHGSTLSVGSRSS